MLFDLLLFHTSEYYEGQLSHVKDISCCGKLSYIIAFEHTDLKVNYVINFKNDLL